MVLFPIKFHPSIKSFCECKLITAKYEPNVNTEASGFDIHFKREFRTSNVVLRIAYSFISHYLLYHDIHFVFLLSTAGILSLTIACFFVI